MILGLDPGHGLGNLKRGVYDPGNTGGGQAEATLALEWALTLKYYATEAGIKCWLTRTSRDYAAPLSARIERAKAAGCTRLISIHCNEFNGLVRGTETFYRAGSTSGQEFAQLVQSAALEGLRGLDSTWESRGVKEDTESQHKSGLKILRGGLLACLLEIGFQDNDDDRKLMVAQEARVAVCQRIVAGLKELI